VRLSGREGEDRFMLRYVMIAVIAAGAGIGAAYLKNGGYVDAALETASATVNGSFETTAAPEDVQQNSAPGDVATGEAEASAADPQQSEAEKRRDDLLSPCKEGSDVSRVTCGFGKVMGGGLTDALRDFNQGLDEAAARRAQLRQDELQE
jgi:hypothetical protein